MRNMKKIIFFFSLLSISFHAYNQEIEFKEIDNWIKNNPGELVPIRIEFNDNIDCYKLNHDIENINAIVKCEKNKLIIEVTGYKGRNKYNIKFFVFPKLF